MLCSAESKCKHGNAESGGACTPRWAYQGSDKIALSQHFHDGLQSAFSFTPRYFGCKFGEMVVPWAMMFKWRRTFQLLK